MKNMKNTDINSSLQDTVKRFIKEVIDNNELWYDSFDENGKKDWDYIIEEAIIYLEEVIDRKDYNFIVEVLNIYKKRTRASITDVAELALRHLGGEDDISSILKGIRIANASKKKKVELLADMGENSLFYECTKSLPYQNSDCEYRRLEWWLRCLHIDIDDVIKFTPKCYIKPLISTFNNEGISKDDYEKLIINIPTCVVDRNLASLKEDIRIYAYEPNRDRFVRADNNSFNYSKDHPEKMVLNKQ